MELTWTPDLAIGHNSIDRQHIQLFGYLDEFAEGCTKGSARETLISLFGKLKDYANAHFCEEEKLMQTVNYPEIEKHQREHGVFKKDLMMLKNKITAENITILDVIQMNKFLVSWLVNHVKESDQRLGVFLRNLSADQ